MSKNLTGRHSVVLRECTSVEIITEHSRASYDDIIRRMLVPVRSNTEQNDAVL